MAFILQTIKSIYRVAPLTIKLSVSRSNVINSCLKHLLAHDTLYDSDYYERVVEEPAVRSAGVISESILLYLRPKNVVDVGCGTGALLEALREKGCQVFGLDYSKAALEYCHARDLDVVKFDIEKDVFNDDRSFDVAVSMEVAEHLPERTAQRYIDLLTRLSNMVVFSAASLGQGGLAHINEQPPRYWVSKFQDRDFEHDEQLSKHFHDSWKATRVVADCYYRNLMIFGRLRRHLAKR